MRQALINLLGNAIKFTERGNGDADLEMMEKNQLHCSVRDTGIGIAEDARGKLFQRFAQADASIAHRFGGTGLGLVICKQLVEGSGGQIGFDSAVGAGSTFWFTLPVAEGNAATAISANSTVQPIPSLHILLVEDDDLNRQVARELLEHDGHRAIACASGREALSLLAENIAIEPPFDAVLMDVHMPEMDGMETTRQIRRSPPSRAGDIADHRADGRRDRERNPAMSGGRHGRGAGQAYRPGGPASGARRPSPAGIGAVDNAQLLDLTLLRQHRDALSRDRLEPLLRQLHDRSAGLTAAIQDAWRRGEWSALAELAHRLSGVAANFELHALGQQARAIEQAAEQSQPDELARLVPDLAALHTRSLEALVSQD
ncbi:MAG: ATP-binding protein [Candidatus Moduliflexus flocculans]|nr:ATP-binding protein [Candidatus Moduliflexus flocculans]